MSILDVIKEVCPVIGLKVPDAVFSSTEREHVELKALANKMAKRIAFDSGHDWTELKQIAALAGDGVTQAFDLPPDYKRMLKKARLWPSDQPFAPMVHYPDTDEWLAMNITHFSTVTGRWTMMGEKLLVLPIQPAGTTVNFAYISNNIARTKDRVLKVQFTDDTDVFRLSERVLELGMVWQWKANKGMPYAEDMSNYEDTLAMETGSNKGSNILTMGRQRYGGADIAFPGVIKP